MDFLRRVFYRRVPRKQMVQLLSGIILMVMNCRVEDVKQWGKHDGRESLEVMKCLGNHKKMDATIRAAIVDACLVQISDVFNKGGYARLIKYQSDWYPIYRMLQEIGEYGNGEEEKFCKRIVSPDLTRAAYIQRLDDAQKAGSAYLYCKMDEVDMLKKFNDPSQLHHRRDSEVLLASRGG